MATILLPIPSHDFDPTEVAVSSHVLTERGHEVVFSTPSGEPGQADDIMLTGRGLDPWGIIPLARNVTVVGRILGANTDAREAHTELLRDPGFGSPLPWRDVRGENFDGLLLPGGHRARSIDPTSGRSVLYGRRTTALTWQLERAAWAVGRRTRFWDPHYYRTYREGPGQPAGHMSVQQEVTRALARAEDFLDVDPGVPDHSMKMSGRSRDTMTDARPAWVVRDKSYVSARWPGDVHTFALALCQVLAEPALGASG